MSADPFNAIRSRRAAVQDSDPESSSSEEEEKKESAQARNKRLKAEADAKERKAQELKRAKAARDREERIRQRQLVTDQRAAKDRQEQLRAYALKQARLQMESAKEEDDGGWGIDPDILAKRAADVRQAGIYANVKEAETPSGTPLEAMQGDVPMPQPSRPRRLLAGASSAVTALFQSRVATATARHISSVVSYMSGSSSQPPPDQPAPSAVSVASASPSELEELQAAAQAVEQVAEEASAAADEAEAALTPKSAMTDVIQAAALRDAAESFAVAAEEQKEAIAEEANPLLSFVYHPAAMEQVARYHTDNGATDDQLYQWLWQAYASHTGGDLPTQADTPWLERKLADLFGLRSGPHFRADLDAFMVMHGAWKPAHVRAMEKLRDRTVHTIQTAPLSSTTEEYAEQLRELILQLTGVRIQPSRNTSSMAIAMLALVQCI